MIITVKHDLKDYRKGLKRIQKRQLPKAVRPALNRAGNSARGAGVKAVSKLMGLAQKRIRKAMVFIKAKGRELVAVIVARGGPLNIMAFAARSETRAKARARGGVRAKIGGRFQVFRGTFIGNDGKTAFRRVGKRRLPIEPERGPSIPDTMDQTPVQEAIREQFLKRWPIEFARTFARHVKG